MATYTYEIGQIKRSVTSPKGKGNYSYGAQHVFLPTNDIPPFSTINSVTLTHTKTNSTGTFRKSVYRSTTADSTVITTTPLTFNVSTVGGSQTARAGKMLYHFSIYTSAQGTGTIVKKSTTSTATRDNVTLTYDYTPPNTIISFFIKNPDTGLDESFPFSKVNEISKYTTTANVSYDPSDYSSGSYIPVPFNGSLTSETSATLVVDPNYNYYSGYHPSYWTDGTNQYSIDTNGNTNINWESSDTEKSFTLVFAKNTYTVNFWDNTKNPAVLVESMTCEGDTTYSTPAFPQYEAREGYVVNTTGWIKDLIYSGNTGYNKIFKQQSSTTLYYYQPPTTSITSIGTTSYSVTQYSSFTNLSTTNGDIVNLYFIYIPIRYSINYKSRLSTSSSYGTTTQYRVYGENIAVLNLTSAKSLTTGYKWLNTSPNYWYTTEKTTSTGYLPEGEQINSISPTYAGDINLYSYQVPIEYQVVRHIYDINGNEIDFNGAEILNCEYGTTYNRDENLILENPLTINSQALVEESYENKVNDAQYGFTLNVNDGINTYTKDTFTTTGVAMMKLNIKAKNPCILTLNLTGKCYYTYNRFFISKLDGDPLSSDYSTTDNSSLLSYYFSYTSSQSFSNQRLKFLITEGTHWLYIKYRRTSSSTNYQYTDYNSFSFTTSYEAIRINQDITGWYDNTQTIDSSIGIPSPFSISNTIGTHIASVGTSYKESLLNTIGLQTFDYDFDSSFSNLTTTDGAIIHYYAYYIPGKQYINYTWLDSLGQKDMYKINPNTYLYNKTNGTIKDIPDYEQYIEDNAGTKAWYYYANNDLETEQLTNFATEVSSTILGDTYFYGYKTSAPRTITINNPYSTYGNLNISNSINTYAEGDTVQVYAIPTSIGYFDTGYYVESSEPSIQNLLTGYIQDILIKDSNITIYPTFRSSQIYIPQFLQQIEEGEG